MGLSKNSIDERKMNQVEKSPNSLMDLNRICTLNMYAQKMMILNEKQEAQKSAW